MGNHRTKLQRLAYFILPTLAIVLLVLLVLHLNSLRNSLPPQPVSPHDPAASNDQGQDMPAPGNSVPDSETGAVPEVEHWVYRKKSDYDPGTIRVYLRNAGDAPLRIKKVLLNELPIPVWGVDLNFRTVQPEGILAATDANHTDIPQSAALRFSGNRIVWARLAPETIPPGQTAEFAAKLSNPMARPMKVEFLPDTGEEKLALVVRPLQPKISVTAVTFSANYDRVYTYVENCGEDPLEIADFQLDGHSEKTRSWWGAGAFAYGEKRLIVTDLANPLQQGEYIMLKVVTTAGTQAMERVRVFGGFPVNLDGGGGFKDFSGDDEVYVINPDYFAKPYPLLNEPPDISQEPSLAANYIFMCAMHEYGCDHERCARETLRRYNLCRRFDPSHPSFVHLCRIRPETGYALFAETADILRINSNIVTGLLPPPAFVKETATERVQVPSEENVEPLTRYAVSVAAPRPVHAVADTSPIEGNKDDFLASVSDFRRRTWTILGSGVKGIFYRHRQPDTPQGKDLNREIDRTNRVLRQLHDYLAVAAPADWASASDEHFTVQTLLAGDRAIIVFLVRHNFPSPDDPSIPIPIRVRIPPWLSVDMRNLEGASSPVAEIGPLGAIPIPLEKAADGDVVFNVAPPADATAILLKIERGQP